MALDVLSDGFVKLCIDPSLNFYDGKCRVLLEGQYVVNAALATPVAPDLPVRVPSVRYIDDMFTAGSVLAEGLKMLFCICPGSIEVFALPRQDASGAVKAVYTLTVTGPATSDGTVDIFLGDKQYSVDGVIVTAGDTDATIAAAIAAAIPQSFPYAVTVAANVVTLTAKNGGTVGNYLAPVINWKGFQNYFPSGVGIAVAQATPGSVDPAPIDYRTALGECCYSCYGLLGGDRTWQRGLRDHIRDAWDCTKPQCFGHGYTYNAGSLGQVLAAGDNSGELSRVAVPLNDVSFPWAIVAGYVARSCCSACDNPELNVQGRTHGVLSCVERPASCTSPWTYDEMVQLRDAGFVTYGPLTQGSGLLTYPYIHNDVTNYLYDEMNRPNATFRDASSRRLAAKTAIAVAAELGSVAGLSYYTYNTRIPEGVFGTNKRLMLAMMHTWARSQVGTLFGEFDNLERDLTLKDDFEVAAPCQGVPCKLHMHMRYRPPCRLSGISVSMQPKLFDNCAR